ncbi:MAG: serine/threonine protein kinase [Acidobacteriota bacterium]|nr:serine/threonine protein kinase [Acidobacteriota bacterium]
MEEPDSAPKIETQPPAENQTPIKKPSSPLQKPLPRISSPNEILDVDAILADRKINPTGRLALTRANTNVLLGQKLKDRFYITEKISEDESVVSYLAEDRSAGNEKVLVKVLLDEDAEDNSAGKIFAEERASLAQINHPNLVRVIDADALPEGKPFIIYEIVEGESVKDMLAQSGQFNALRAARIVRQASYALSEAHQNNILHRALTPENILLPISEDGAEQVKLTDFGISKGEIKPENMAFKAPEQIEGKIPTVAGDIYSLAAIAFQMLTNRLPFEAAMPAALLASQRKGLKFSPTNLRFDITTTVDEILEKALAFNPSERYLKASEFGDTFFNALTTTALWKGDERSDEDTEPKEESVIKAEREEIGAGEIIENEIPASYAEESSILELPPLSLDAQAKAFDEENLLPISEADASPATPINAPEITVPKNGKKPAKLIPAIDANWESPLPKLSKTATVKTRNWTMPALIGALIILSALGLGYWAYNRPAQTQVVQTPAQNNDLTGQNVQNAANLPVAEKVEPAPPAAKTAPPNTIYFENSKQNLRSAAARNFLGFSLYYPNDWKRNDAKNNFLDISKNAPTGTPIEQMLVSYYDSKGNFKDDKKVFPSLVKETNSTLKTIVPDYKLVSQKEKTINGDLKAYEVRFTGKGKTAKGEDIKLWGRRLFVPAARDGAKNGYVLTMLATSLSPDVKSLEDVGVKGELRTVLDTFAPDRNF